MAAFLSDCHTNTICIDAVRFVRYTYRWAPWDSNPQPAD